MSFVERVNQGESLASWLNWLTDPPAVCWSVIMGDLSASCKGEKWTLPKAFRTGPGSCAVHSMLPEASFGLRVLTSPASVCVSVWMCINHLLVHTITHQPFTLESPNLNERRKTPWLRCLLFLGVINFDIQGQIWLESRILPHFELVCTITFHLFKLESPHLDQKCILIQFRSLLILGVINLQLQFHFKS